MHSPCTGLTPWASRSSDPAAGAAAGSLLTTSTTSTKPNAARSRRRAATCSTSTSATYPQGHHQVMTGPAELAGALGQPWAAHGRTGSGPALAAAAAGHRATATTQGCRPAPNHRSGGEPAGASSSWNLSAPGRAKRRRLAAPHRRRRGRGHGRASRRRAGRHLAGHLRLAPGRHPPDQSLQLQDEPVGSLRLRQHRAFLQGLVKQRPHHGATWAGSRLDAGPSLFLADAMRVAGS